METVRQYGSIAATIVKRRMERLSWPLGLVVANLLSSVRRVTTTVMIA